MRNLGLLIAFWLTAVLPTSSLALGLGEIQVNSFLNQPLTAEIEVLSARPGEIDDLLVSLASREAFTRAGLARPRHLSDLRFAVEKSEDGDSAVIKVTTRSAVKEPFMNFLIEADWSKGRLLREFTVLLDPPFYAEQPPAVEAVSEESLPAATDDTEMSELPKPTEDESQAMTSSETITEPIALSEDSSSEAQAPAPEMAAPAATSPPASSEYVDDESQNIIQGDVSVVKGDTLWSIASRFKDDDHSMAQVMLAFLRANPNAFVDGNINNMKAGAVLRAPDAAELDALGQQAAYAEVLTQNGLWDEYVARVTGVAPSMAATTSEEVAQAPEKAAGAAEGELSLLVPGEGSSDSSGTGDSADIDQLRTKLALAEEELEASRIENNELESRIADLQERVSKFEELQKIVELEDDSLAAIQAGQTGDVVDGESEESLGAETPVSGTDVVGESMKSDEEALLEELLAEEAAAQAQEQAGIQQGDMPDGESEAPVSDDLSGEQVASADDQMVDDETSSGQVAAAPPAPVIITQPASTSDSMLDGILPTGVGDMIPSLGGIFGDPIILAAIGGVIVLLLVLFVVKRRKSSQDSDSGITAAGEDDLFASDDEEDLTPIHLTEAEEPVETDIKLPGEEDMAAEEVIGAGHEEDDFGKTAIVSAADVPEAEAEAEEKKEAPAAAAAEQDDVLNEVDVYLAYGLYDNAEDLLNNSLAENPGRADYRSKLLDTYFATKNAEAFAGEAENLKGMGDKAKPYWDRVQIMGYELAPDNALFSDAKGSGLSAADLEIAKPQEADFDLGGDDEDNTGFSTTDFNLAEEDTGGNFSETAALGEAGELESTQQISSEEDAGDDDSLELPDDIGSELEFSMDDEVDSESSESSSDELELPADELELPDDLDIDATEAVLAESEAPDEGDDVGLDFDIDDDALGLDDAEDAFDLDDLDDVEGALDVDDAVDDDAVEISAPQDEDISDAPTAIITPNYEETEVLQRDVDDSEDDSAIDLSMEDTAMMAGADSAEETGELMLDDDVDDEEDISIIDFGGDDFVEPTDIVEAVSEDDEFELDEEDEEVRTGTFAPGDFEEPTAVQSLSDVDDMDDLMLPDDVDEVSTKLDLARAFIDMGDTEGARGSLEEVMSEGNAEQKAEAKALLDQI